MQGGARKTRCRKRAENARILHLVGVIAVLVAVPLSGCGQQAGAATAEIEITQAGAAQPPEATSAAPAADSHVRTGTRRTPSLVTAPAAPEAATAPAAAVPTRRKPRRYRRSQMQVLRAHCATRPADDPRCRDGRVVERVAFAALEDGR